MHVAARHACHLECPWLDRPTSNVVRNQGSPSSLLPPIMCVTVVGRGERDNVLVPSLAHD
jgi:hypothetical protein